MSFGSISSDTPQSNSFTNGFTADFLKIFAILSMTIDHVAIAIIGALMRVTPAPLYDSYMKILNNLESTAEELATVPADFQKLYQINQIMRLVGRIAFPIFVFLLYEGFKHTSDVKKYLLRLGIFALISEIPFNLLSSFSSTGKMQLFYPRHQNTLFELLLCLLTLILLKKLEKDTVNPQAAMFQWTAQFLVLMGVCLLSVICFLDYGYTGPLMIGVLYFCEGKKGQQLILTAIVLLITNNLYACLALFPIGFYNGKRAKSVKFKYFFYIYYPVHLAVLSGVCWYILQNVHTATPW